MLIYNSFIWLMWLLNIFNVDFLTLLYGLNCLCFILYFHLNVYLFLGLRWTTFSICLLLGSFLVVSLRNVAVLNITSLRNFTLHIFNTEISHKILLLTKLPCVSLPSIQVYANFFILKKKNADLAFHALIVVASCFASGLILHACKPFEYCMVHDPARMA